MTDPAASALRADNEHAPDYDVAVIGGGPAGSTAAAYLRQANLRVAVFEGAHFPRDHVGESLVPATTPVLVETGAMPKVDAAGFPKKYGAAWTSAESSNVPHNGFDNLTHDFRAAEILFNERDQDGVQRDYTYHVDRSKFDEILLDHAQSLGAEVCQGTRVIGTDFTPSDRVLLDVRDDTATRRVSARMVVDASGRKTVLGSQFGFKQSDPVFNQYAVHTWFKDLDREALAVTEGQTDYIFIHFLPLTDTWMWQIPITDEITSIGVVTQKERFKAFDGDREDFFWETVRSREDLTIALKAAERVKDFKTEGDYSYAMTQVAGDRFVMIGDAARFVDPIFSSGVSVAMNSARLACRDIVAAFESGGAGADGGAGPDLSHESFGRFENTLRRGVQSWYEFISIYYRLNILFTAFVQDPRYRLDVLKMLQGDVYDDEEPAALAAMREVVSAVEADPTHLWHRYLGELKAPAAAAAF